VDAARAGASGTAIGTGGACAAIGTSSDSSACDGSGVTGAGSTSSWWRGVGPASGVASRGSISAKSAETSAAAWDGMERSEAGSV
jgi:hypothetical protein